MVVALGSSAGLLLDALSGPSAEEAANLIYAATLTAVPVAMGIAVVRHRLFDIDLVLHRTLIYGVLTAILSGAYLATALLLGLALGGSDLAVAGATLAVAALFRPGRARVQAAADRRFHRSRYDAARTLNPFGARLRNEVDLDAVSAQLRAVAPDALQPAAVSLRLRR